MNQLNIGRVWVAGFLGHMAISSLQMDAWGMTETIRRLVDGWVSPWISVPVAVVGFGVSLWVYRKNLEAL